MSYLDNIDSENILNKLRDLESRIKILESSTITDVEQLSDISSELGVIQSGEFRSGEGEPDNGFTGVRMGYPGMAYTVDGEEMEFNVAGINNDTLQFGLDATSGAAIAGGGAVKIDEDGVTIKASTGANVNPGGVTNKNSLSFTDSDGAIVESDVIPANYAGGKRIWVRCGYDTYNLSAESTLHALTSLGEIYAGVQLWDGGNRFIIASTSINAALQLYMAGKIAGTSAIGCRVYRNSTQAITASQWNNLSWNTEVNDTDSCWSSGDGSKMYAKSDGYYMAGGGFAVSCTAYIGIFHNGATMAMNGQVAASRFDITTGMFYMNVDDYIQIGVNPTANVTVAAAGATTQYANHGWLVRVA